jgi:hypothetical protein
MNLTSANTELYTQKVRYKLSYSIQLIVHFTQMSTIYIRLYSPPKTGRHMPVYNAEIQVENQTNDQEFSDKMMEGVDGDRYQTDRKKHEDAV